MLSDESNENLDNVRQDANPPPEASAGNGEAPRPEPAPDETPSMPASAVDEQGSAEAAPSEAAPPRPEPPRRRLPTAAEIQPPTEPAPAEHKMDWYILKVQSNREESIREALQRRVAIQGMQEYFGDIIVPVEMRTEFKNGKKRVVKHKLYPGYLVVRMEITDDTWFLVRETPGIGDFTGAGGKP